MNEDKKFVVPFYCHPEPHKRHPELVSEPVGRTKGSPQIKKFCVVATQKTGTTTNKKREEKIINNQKGEKKNETEKHN